MKHTHVRLLQTGWAVLFTSVLLALVVTPVMAAQRAQQVTRQVSHAHTTTATTDIDATIYLAAAMLQPLFQSKIDEQVPGAVNSAISSIVSGLPAIDQGWATQMATTLLQPSAQLVSLTPQQDGFLLTLRLNLYNGDPQPITAKMLVKFSVLDSATVQVSIQPVSGSPSLVNGPVATFHMPIGSLNSINTTTTCGDASLAISLKFPISLGNSGTTTGQVRQQSSQSSQSSMRASFQRSAQQQVQGEAHSSVNSYVEIPATSLSQLGVGIGSLPINSSFTAQNIQVSVQGSNLAVNSDIMWGGFRLGVATTTFAPIAQNGNLALKIVGETQLTWANIFQFPFGTYDPQIQQMINAKLSGALTGKFNVTTAAIGPNSHVPCAASNSLVLTGTTSLV